MTVEVLLEGMMIEYAMMLGITVLHDDDDIHGMKIEPAQALHY